MDRRELFRSLSSSFTKKADERQKIIRPPYCDENSSFDKECNTCEGKCATFCEENIIIIQEDKTPKLDFKNGGCTYCDECANACETNVLELLISILKDNSNRDFTKGCPLGNLLQECSCTDKDFSDLLNEIFGNWSKLFEQTLKKAYEQNEIIKIDFQNTALFLIASLGSGLDKIFEQNEIVPSITDLIFSPEIYIPILGFVFIVLTTLIIRKFFYKN